jgi:hypothetical protein
MTPGIEKSTFRDRIGLAKPDTVETGLVQAFTAESHANLSDTLELLLVEENLFHVLLNVASGSDPNHSVEIHPPFMLDGKLISKGQPLVVTHGQFVVQNPRLNVKIMPA